MGLGVGGWGLGGFAIADCRFVIADLRFAICDCRNQRDFIGRTEKRKSQIGNRKPTQP
jgi:hypothetical protein